MSLAAETALNRDCRFAYREATMGLAEQIEEFNSHQNRSDEIKSQALKYFVASVSALETELKAKRAVCYFAEDAANEECVTGYMDIYSSLRRRINLIAMISGNQSDVDMSFLGSLGVHLKIGAQDLRCGY